VFIGEIRGSIYLRASADLGEFALLCRSLPLATLGDVCQNRFVRKYRRET
jgi:hypothetical protein